MVAQLARRERGREPAAFRSDEGNRGASALYFEFCLGWAEVMVRSFGGRSVPGTCALKTLVRLVGRL